MEGKPQDLGKSPSEGDWGRAQSPQHFATCQIQENRPAKGIGGERKAPNISQHARFRKIAQRRELGASAKPPRHRNKPESFRKIALRRGLWATAKPPRHCNKPESLRQIAQRRGLVASAKPPTKFFCLRQESALQGRIVSHQPEEGQAKHALWRESNVRHHFHQRR